MNELFESRVIKLLTPISDPNFTRRACLHDRRVVTPATSACVLHSNSRK